MYDFGDFDADGKMGNPYVKLLSIVDPDAASIEFHKQRGGTPRTGITYVGLDGISVDPTFFISNLFYLLQKNTEGMVNAKLPKPCFYLPPSLDQPAGSPLFFPSPASQFLAAASPTPFWEH